VQDEGIDVGPELGDHERHPLRHQSRNERHVAAKTVELGHHDRALALARRLELRLQLGPALERLVEVRDRVNRNQVEAAERQAALVLPVIKPLLDGGLSLRAIARELTARGVPTARGGQWQAVQVSDIVKRSAP
jgi:hypothetical protein